MSEQTNQVVSQVVPSIDGKGLVHGVAAYTDDFKPVGALVVKALRSPHAFAKITSIDTKKALEILGVACVLTYQDFKRIAITRAGQGYPEPSPHDKFILDSVVRYIGDEVAIVAADTEKEADAALAAIEVTYEVLTPVLNFEKAKGHESIIHPEPEIHEMFPIGFNPSQNIAAAYHMAIGDVDHVLSDCPVKVTETYYTQAQAHAMMEPHTANAHLDVHGRLVIFSATQTPTHVRRILSHGLEVPLNKIRVIKPRVGGGFGGKQCIHAEFFVAAVTLKTKRPSAFVYSREAVFEASYCRHAMRIDVTLGADQQGHLKAIDMKVLSDTGAYGEHALTVFMVAGSKVLPLYNKVDAVRFYGDVVYTNKTPAGAYRGYGAIQGNFALESAMDQLAQKLNLDPVVLREMNMMLEGETSPIFEKMGEGTEGTAMMMDSCKLAECVTRGKALIGWDEKRLSYGAQDPLARHQKGVGMAIAMQGSGIPYIDMGSAVIKLNDDGFYNLTIGATDIGQGSDTILAQMAAECLMTDLDKVVVYASDTDLTPFDCGAYASSTTYISGHAVIQAAENMKALLLQAAAKSLSVEKEQVLFDGKVFQHKDHKAVRMTLKDLSDQLYYQKDQEQLIASGSYVGSKSPPPFMAGFAEVSVDTWTGQVQVLDYVAVVDCGVAINPHLALGQVEGALLQGIGMTLYEEAKRSDKGKLINRDFLTYKIPTRLEVPQIRASLVESFEPSGPYGAKSVGEIGIDTPPAAIANAIDHATHQRFNRLPILPDHLISRLEA